jgi:hypothetical protein
MSTARDLLERARQYHPRGQSLDACWALVVRAIEVEWFNDQELTELLVHLRGHRDFGVEELLFAHLGDRLRVSFVDDQATCAPAEMIAALESISPPVNE